jgi:hypothetical protein
MKTRYWYFPLLGAGIISNLLLPYPYGIIVLAFCQIYAIVVGIKYGIRKLIVKHAERKENLNSKKHDFEHTLQDFKKCGVDPYYTEQLILSRCSEGRNIDKNGKEFWVCSHCTSNIKFETKEEYVSHHNRVHS